MKHFVVLLLSVLSVAVACAQGMAESVGRQYNVAYLDIKAGLPKIMSMISLPTVSDSSGFPPMGADSCAMTATGLSESVAYPSTVMPAGVSVKMLSSVFGRPTMKESV